MANRRNLKKEINSICSNLFAECVAITLQKGNEVGGAVDSIMTDILNLQDDSLSRISHTQKDKSKEFYKQLYADFNAKASTIIEAIDKLG